MKPRFSSLIRLNSSLFLTYSTGTPLVWTKSISILILFPIHPLLSRGKRLPRRSFFDRKSVGEVAIVPILVGRPLR